MGLVDIASVLKGSWLIGGDFNEVLKARDNSGVTELIVIGVTIFGIALIIISL